MIATEIVARLETLDPQPFLVIEDAAGLAALDRLTKNPAVYVVTAAETAAGAKGLRPHQMVAANVEIIMAVREHGDRRGDAKRSTIEALRADVRRVLYGFTPASAKTPLIYRTGKLLKLGDSELWWADAYQTQYVIQAV